MDDLLVLILTAVFILAGIFGQKNKKKNIAEKDSVVTEPPKEDLWDFLDRKWEDSSSEEVTPEVIVEDVPAPKRGREYQFHPKKESERTFMKDPSKNIKEKQKARILKKSKFPLKDAVIYSEILHRKYI